MRVARIASAVVIALVAENALGVVDAEIACGAENALGVVGAEIVRCVLIACGVRIARIAEIVPIATNAHGVASPVLVRGHGLLISFVHGAVFCHRVLLWYKNVCQA